MSVDESDPFRRIAEGGSSDGSSSPAGSIEEFAGPLPRGAPIPSFKHPRLGGPCCQPWPYLSHDGRVLFYVVRFPKAAPEEEGRDRKTWTDKEVLPLTPWRTASGIRWRWKAPPAPRPLYGLDRLDAKPDALVLVVEGEKTADAAAQEFPELVVVSWQGGSNAAAKADWSPLRGRRVVILPDADEPGRKAAREVDRHVREAEARTVGTAALPAGLPSGWDIADGWQPAFSKAEALARIDEAGLEARSKTIWPPGCRMEPDGLWADEFSRTGQPVPVRLAAPFDVVGEARDVHGGGWAVVVRFRDPDGRQKTLPLPKGKLAGGGAEIRADLADAGLFVAPQRGRAEKFAAALAEVNCGLRLRLVESTGWCGSQFVLPDQVLGPSDEEVLFHGDSRALHYRHAGEMAEWQANIAALALGNPLLALALSAAFTGPLLRDLGAEGGGIHFRGHSSSGKTTLARAAGSVWGGGGPLGYGHNWRATSNALENLAFGHNDALLILDELGMVAPEDAGAAAYSLASGQSKARSRANGTLRHRSEWRIFLVSTGEVGLAEHIATSKRAERAMAGQELRLLEVHTDAGRGMGIWEELHGADNPASLSDRLNAACRRDYGHAGPTFVEKLIGDRKGAERFAREVIAAFVQDVIRKDDTGQVQRAAQRFGLIAAAGELAATFGILPWHEGWAIHCAKLQFLRWASSFGRTAHREDLEVTRRLCAAIEREQSRFALIGQAEGGGPEPVDSALHHARSLSTLGYRQARGGETIYMFHRAGWAEVLTSLDLKQAARLVARAGFLDTEGSEARLQKSVRINGERHRLYCVRSGILDADLGGE